MTTSLSDIDARNPLVLIGGGRMGAAMLSGWLAGGLSSDAVMVVEPFDATRQALQAAHHGLQGVEIRISTLHSHCEHEIPDVVICDIRCQ